MEDNEIMLKIGEDGKLDIYNPEDYIEITKKDADMIVEFINQNENKFVDFAKEWRKNDNKRKT